jgi:hypothetical protein
MITKTGDLLSDRRSVIHPPTAAPKIAPTSKSVDRRFETLADAQS